MKKTKTEFQKWKSIMKKLDNKLQIEKGKGKERWHTKSEQMKS